MESENFQEEIRRRRNIDFEIDSEKLQPPKGGVYIVESVETFDSPTYGEPTPDEMEQRRTALHKITQAIRSHDPSPEELAESKEYTDGLIGLLKRSATSKEIQEYIMSRGPSTAKE